MYTDEEIYAEAMKLVLMYDYKALSVIWKREEAFFSAGNQETAIELRKIGDKVAQILLKDNYVEKFEKYLRINDV